MKPYSEYSFAPKSIRTSIQGSTGFANEPFSLITSPIEENLLIVSYEHPISVKELGDTLGIPCAYLEPIVEKLVEGEVLGRTDGGLIYTRCFMQDYDSYFGDVSAQEALATSKASSVFDVFFKHIQPLTMREEFTSMNDKQKATLWLFLLHSTLQQVTSRVTDSCQADVPLPERPNGGRWLMMGSIFNQNQSRNSRYDASGPYTWNHGHPTQLWVADFQTRFGDTHWCYPKGSHNDILSLYASFFDPNTKPHYGRTYECIPDLINLHILRRNENGEAVPDFPAMTIDCYETFWQPALKAAEEELLTMLEDDLTVLRAQWIRKVPKHVDAWESFVHWGALNSYALIQTFAVVDANLLPYPVEVGKTPLIFLKYRQ